MPSPSSPTIRSPGWTTSPCRPTPPSAPRRPPRTCCGARLTSCARCRAIRRCDRALRALFRDLPGGCLEVLEFVCFFRGISFCQNAGAPAARRFAPGRSADVSESNTRSAPKGETSIAMTEHFRSIALTVNGEHVHEIVEARTSLVDFLRDRLGLTGSHVGCEQGVCGACTVRLDGVTVRGCLMLAVQCAGSKVDTIEGVSDTGEIADLQEAFVRRNALQCGFCTPGMLLSAQELLAQGGVPSREEIRAHLSGNYCRCTGYQAIVDAIEAVARLRLGPRASRPLSLPLEEKE